MSIRRKIKRLPLTIKDAFSKLPESNICLWHAGRCGSTVLASLIDEDGRLNWKGEFLEARSKDVELRGEDSEASWMIGLNELERAIECKDRRPLGIEMKLWHLARLRKTVEEAYTTLSPRLFQKHIILERKNYFRVYLSGQVLHASGASHIKDEKDIYREKVGINVQQLMKEINICDDFYRALKEALPPDSLYLSYEDDISDNPATAYHKLMKSIGLKPRTPTTKLKKTNARPIKEMVANWEEIASALVDTPHQWMIEEC